MSAHLSDHRPFVPFPDGVPQECVELVRSTLRLTRTQAIIAIGIWQALPEKQIAAGLQRSTATVHQHTRAIYAQLAESGFVGRVGVAVAVERVLGPRGSGPEPIRPDTNG